LNADIIELIRIANHFDDDQIVAKWSRSYRSLKYEFHFELLDK
jgi:hypothetical protein